MEGDNMKSRSKMWKYFSQEAEQLFELLDEGVAVLDENQQLIYANTAFLRCTELDLDECRGKIWTDIYPGSVIPAVYGTKHPVYYHGCALPNGTKTSVDILPFEESGALIGVLIIIHSSDALPEPMQKPPKEEIISQATEHRRISYPTRYTFENIVGADAAYVRLAKKVAQTDNSVLLIGESGTGKEVIAQSIHHESARRGQPFVDINCASLHETLLESELFGYVPGAFTGASKSGRVGLLEAANGGTVFLDEITEMSVSLQSKLLRVLQERQIRRVGDNKNIKIDIRVIAATNQDIEKAIAENRFRQDLFYRLAVITIRIPPLRERSGDFDDYLRYFLNALGQRYGRHFQFSGEARQILRDYRWPGNVRELQNVLEHCCLVTATERITPSSLPRYVRNGVSQAKANKKNFVAHPSETLSKSLQRAEREIICAMLNHYGTSTTAKVDIAKALGISVSTLYNKLKKLGIDDRDFNF